jgi:hypothetical protein
MDQVETILATTFILFLGLGIFYLKHLTSTLENIEFSMGGILKLGQNSYRLEEQRFQYIKESNIRRLKEADIIDIDGGETWRKYRRVGY